jgi:hypothetical protein
MDGELPARREGLPVKSGARIATPSTSTTSLLRIAGVAHHLSGTGAESTLSRDCDTSKSAIHLKIGRADLCFNRAVRKYSNRRSKQITRNFRR